jgi:hypothetical protein
MEDIFSVLSRYGVSSEENYLTEAFVYVIKLLLARRHQEGLKFLNLLCDPISALSDPKAIQISTQVSYEGGRPDIEIRSLPDALVFIEVKHDSPLSPNQLEIYLNELRATGLTNTSLVFLSRSLIAAQLTTLPPDQYHHVCWYEIHDWLSELSFSDEVCEHFIRDFIIFLEGKNMTIKKVSWEYIEGVPAMLNLTHLIETAISEVRPSLKIRRTAGWNWRGFYLDNNLWCGVWYDRPLKIVFENKSIAFFS